MCLRRQVAERGGLDLWKGSHPWHDRFVGVALGSSEMGHPPLKFGSLDRRCGELGFRLCRHAGEEGPPQYVREALLDIGVDRIDHGNRSMEDPALIYIHRHTHHHLPNCPRSTLYLSVTPHRKDRSITPTLTPGSEFPGTWAKTAF